MNLKIGTGTILLNPAGDKILVSERLTELEFGKVGTPGGKLEPGESPLEANRREILEETAESPLWLIPYPALTSDILDGERHHICIWFLGQLTADKVPYVEMKSGKPKHKPWVYMLPSEMIKLPLMRSTKEVIEHFIEKRTDLLFMHNGLINFSR